MNGPAIPRSRRSRLALIVAPVLACLAVAAAAPAQAGDYYGGYGGGYGRGYGGGYGCGVPRCGGYGYRPYYHRHSSCWRWGCGSRVFERRYVVREFVERSYGGGPIRHYGCGGYGHGCGGYGGGYGYDGGGYGSYGAPFPGTHRSWTSHFPYGYGGVRGAAAPYDSPYGYDSFDY